MSYEACHPERERGTWRRGWRDAPGSRRPPRFLAGARNDVSHASCLAVSCLGFSHSFDRAAVAIEEPTDGIRERARIVPHVISFGDDVAEERRDAELADRIGVERDRMLILLRVR